jgi:hypothetical protein
MLVEQRLAELGDPPGEIGPPGSRRTEVRTDARGWRYEVAVTVEPNPIREGYRLLVVTATDLPARRRGVSEGILIAADGRVLANVAVMTFGPRSRG